MDKATTQAIYKAVRAGDEAAAKQLLMQHPEALQFAFAGANWMCTAVLSGDLNTVKVLFELGVDINRPNPKMGGPLWHAIKEGKQEIAEWLLDHGANVNQFDVLGTAALKGNLPLVKLLLKRGANLHARWGGKSGEEFNALAMAEVYGHKEIAEYLRKQGAVPPR